MTKYCSNCGTKISEASKFCSNCGSKIAPREKTSEITITSSEAEEIATSLVFSAGALIPENQETQVPQDDKNNITKITHFLDKLLQSFPEIKNETWIGLSEYEKIKKYQGTSSQSTASSVQNLKPPLPPPPAPIEQHPEKTPAPSPVNDNIEISRGISENDRLSDEVVKSRIIGVRTIFPQIYYILFITNRRIIAARKDRFDSAMESGAAFGGILGAMVGAGVDAIKGPKETTQDKLEELSMDEILAFDKQNWEMPYSELRQVELIKPGWLQDGEIILFDAKRKFDLVFDVEKDEFEKVINMFKDVIPEKLKIK